MTISNSPQFTEIGTRIEDYLNDKFQTAADFEGIDQLLLRVREQQALLKSQLESARKEHREKERIAKEHAQALQIRGAEFQQRQGDIDQQLMRVTASHVSDEAVAKLESRMGKVRRMELASGYIQILKEVNALDQAIHIKMSSHPQDALSSYHKLRALLKALHDAQPAAEGAAPHLVDEVEKGVKAAYDDLRIKLEANLTTLLEKMAWPQKELKLARPVVEEWQRATELLLRLQEADWVMFDHPMGSTLEPTVLLPLETMVKPLALRFQYHFYGKRPTNRLDKPEYFFSHVLDILDQHSRFMTELFQPIIDARIQQVEALDSIYTDATSAFITALLPMVTAKCLSLLPQITNQPQLLSHLVHELMSFDSTLRDSWAYTPAVTMLTEWKGLTWEILTTHGYFSKWLSVEKEFALSRYRTIRDATESNAIDYDGVERDRTKPTKGAVRVNDLLETITDRYRTLSSFSQKMRFLMDIQLSIFDDYHGHLYGALQAYLVTSHTAGRLIQGQTESEAVGPKGLETLVKIFGSAEYLEKKMADWSDDIFFLELWDELQDRARRNTGGSASVGRDLAFDDVAAKTSSSIKSIDDPEDGALFDEAALSYRRLKERTESEVVRALEINIRGSIRPFTKTSVWSSLSSATSDPSLLSPSAALDSLLQTLATLLEFLTKTLAVGPLRRITKQACVNIQREIYDNIVLRNTFSAAGAAQLKRDYDAVAERVNSSVNMTGEAQRNMKRLGDALKLLSLPIKPSGNDSDEIEEADGWGFEESEAADGALQEVSRDEEDSTSPGLWQAEKAIFASNESARKVLADLSLHTLSESDARNIIRRRIEINS